jgi:spore coat polysaccharide biosynthesis protein SpsF
MIIGIFLIARLGSTRLPGKNMLKIMGKPMIELMIERVKASHLIDKVVITTSSHPTDDMLEELAHKLKVGCFRGSLENVMDRICNAAEAHDCDTIVELLGDNPLVHCELIDDVIEFYQAGGYDYAATVTKEYPVSRLEKKLFPTGIRVQVYSRQAAEQWKDYPEYANDETKSTTAFIFEHPEKYKTGYFEAKGKWAFINKPDLTFAVNYRKNFEMIQAIFERNYPQDRIFSLKKVFEQMEKEKHLYQLMDQE